MERYQATPCPGCGTRLTLWWRKGGGAGHVTRHAVQCPVCRTAVPFAIRGVLNSSETSLICYERPEGKRPKTS